MYELCAREPPFNAKTHFQLVQKIKEGKVPPLPEMYSPDLNQVIKDCLKVNPDRRPDTAAMLNLPVVKLMRKEKEVVDLNKSLRAREESVRAKEHGINERLANLDRERLMIREEIDSSLRREWEVKARLEIDRLVGAEVERLHQRFDQEVQARVDAELNSKKTVSFAPEERHDDDDASSLAKSDFPHSSIGASGDEFPSTTDITEYSVDSPDTSRELKKPSARTPFGRAQTMFAGQAGTPMDIEMASPSPIAIASLSLSPRRNGATKAPSTHTGNIFAAANAGDLRWELPREPALVDSDDDDDVAPPSPTRQIRSSKNPFTSKSRPVLTSQKSCPVNRLRPQSSNTGLTSKAATSVASTSPGRRLSKIPSAANLQLEAANSSGGSSGGLTRKPSLTKKDGGEALGKVAAKNNIKGRTLVELQQARAGGRPTSAVGGENPNLSPKRGAAFRDRVAGERRGSGGEPVAVWDPERDEMPSPFLVRHRKMARA
jgi:NIMA (never in mitosis gene a)-related kinase